MCAEQDLRRLPEAFAVHRGGYPPGEAFPQRVAEPVLKKAVTICPRERVKAGMKIRVDGFGFSHGKVGGQFRIKRGEQFFRRVRPIVEIERRRLPRRMDAGIGPPREENRPARPAELTKGIFQFALHRPRACLPLTSGKPGTVVG